MNDGDLGTIWASIKLDTRGFSVGVESAQRQLSEMGRKMTVLTSTHSEAMRMALSRVSVGATAMGAAMVAGMGLAARGAVGFEREMRNVNSISRLTEEQLGKVGRAVLEMAREIGKAPEDLARGLYDIASSGFQGAEGLQVLEASARAARAGLATTQESAKAILAVLNSYGMQASQAGRVSDVLFRAVDRGVVTFPELAGSIGAVVNAAASAKVPIEDVAAAYATMTKSGINAEETATALSRIIVSFLSPSQDLAAAIKQAGYESGAAVLQAKGLAGAVQFLNDVTGGAPEKLAALGLEQRALRAGMSLTRDGMAVFQADAAGMREASGATAQAIGEQNKAVAASWEKTIAGLKAAGNEFAQGFLPVLQSISGALSGLARWFGDLSPQAKSAAGGMATFAAATAIAFAAITRVLSMVAGWKLSLEALGMSAGSLASSFVPWLAVAAALGVAVYGIVKGLQKLSQEEGAEAGSASASARTKAAQAGKVRELVNEHEALTAKTRLTRDEASRLKAIDDDLIRLAPHLIKGWDDQKATLILTAGAAREAAKEYTVLRQRAVEAAKAEAMAKRGPVLDRLTSLYERQRVLGEAQQTGRLPYEGRAGTHTVPISAAAVAADRKRIVEQIAAERRRLQSLNKVAGLPLAPAPVVVSGGKGYTDVTPKGTSGVARTDTAGGHGRTLADTGRHGQTQAERADAAAASALSFFEYQIASEAPGAQAGKLAGLQRILEGQDTPGSPYSGLSRQMATQILNEQKQMQDALQEEERQGAERRGQMAAEAALKEAEAQRSAGEMRLRYLEAQGSEELAIEERYLQQVQQLTESGAYSQEAQLALMAERAAALAAVKERAAERQRAAAEREEQEALRRLEYEREHNRISTDDYVRALAERQAAHTAYTQEWYRLEQLIEDAEADRAKAVADGALQLAEVNREAAAQILEGWRWMYANMGDAGAKALETIAGALVKLRKGAADVSEEWRQAFGQALGMVVSHMTDTLVGLLDGSKKFMDGVRDLARDMLRMIVQEVLQAAVRNSSVVQQMGASMAEAFQEFGAGAIKSIATVAVQMQGLLALSGRQGKRKLFGGVIGGVIGALLAPAFTLGTFMTGAGFGSMLFDNPHNDTAAVRSGADFARLFRQGAVSEIGAAWPAGPSQSGRQAETSAGIPGSHGDGAARQEVNVSVHVDRVSAEVDLERAADSLGWIIARRLAVAPTR